MNSKKQETNQQKDPNLLYTLQCILHIKVKVQICKHILSNMFSMCFEFWIYFQHVKFDVMCSKLLKYQRCWSLTRCYKMCWCRARRLFFPHLGSRTTIKQYGLVRNQNLLGHNDKLPLFAFAMKNNKSGINFDHLYTYIFYFRIAVSEHAETCSHIINDWCSFPGKCCLFLSIFTSQGPALHLKRYEKMYEDQKFAFRTLQEI